MSVPDVLSPQERLVLSLRGLYESYGYTRFPMRRFEEYALYLENKSFLTSESVLSFTNASGQLMALKPDVTLSIVKRARPERGQGEKLYYHESVSPPPTMSLQRSVSWAWSSWAMWTSTARARCCA